MRPLSKDLKHKKLEALYNRLEHAQAIWAHFAEEAEGYQEEIVMLQNQIHELENGEEDDEC